MSKIVDDVMAGLKGIRGAGDTVRGTMMEAADKAFDPNPDHPSVASRHEKHRAATEKGRQDIAGADAMLARHEWNRKDRATQRQAAAKMDIGPEPGVTSGAAAPGVAAPGVPPSQVSHEPVASGAYEGANLSTIPGSHPARHDHLNDHAGPGVPASQNVHAPVEFGAYEGAAPGTVPVARSARRGHLNDSTAPRVVPESMSSGTYNIAGQRTTSGSQPTRREYEENYAAPAVLPKHASHEHPAPLSYEGGLRRSNPNSHLPPREYLEGQVAPTATSSNVSHETKEPDSYEGLGSKTIRGSQPSHHDFGAPPVQSFHIDREPVEPASYAGGLGGSVPSSRPSRPAHVEDLTPTMRKEPGPGLTGNSTLGDEVPSRYRDF